MLCRYFVVYACHRNFVHSSSFSFLLMFICCYIKCEIQVRNETAENFYSLLKEWAKLCEEFVLNGSESSDSDMNEGEEAGQAANDEVGDDSSDSEVFEVEKLLEVCYGNPNKDKKKAKKDKKKANEDEKLGLYFKVSLLKLALNLVVAICVVNIL